MELKKTTVRHLKLTDAITPEAQEIYRNVYGPSRSYATLGDILKIAEPEYYKRNIKHFIKAFADVDGMGYTTPEQTNITQNAAEDTPIEPIPREDEWRGVAIQTPDETSGQAPTDTTTENKPEKEPAEGLTETSGEEKSEHAKLIEEIKKHIAMEGIDKAVKADGEKILAKLEEALKLEEAAYGWLEKLKPSQKVPAEENKESKAEEKKEEAQPPTGA